MKTDRLTLLISPADKAAINARAELLGVSVSELLRKAALDYEPELRDEKVQLEALLSEIEVALSRIDSNLDAMVAEAHGHRQEMARLASDEYREDVRRKVLADPGIDWERMRLLVGSAPIARAA